MPWRKVAFVVACLLLAGSSLLSQPPAPPFQPQPPADDPRLDALLTRWEKETANCQSMRIELTCTRKNNVFNRTETLTGEAKFLKLPKDYGVRLELKSPDNPNRYEKYICTGGYIYVYRPEEKLIHIYTLPATQSGQLPDDGALPFLFGMKAETAKKRYQMKITNQTDWYTYVEVLPNFPRDKADFTYARLAILNKETKVLGQHMPREIYWVEPNNIEVKWVITNLQRDVAGSVQREEFVKPTLPAGWQWKQEAITSNPPSGSTRPPTVIRQQDK
jgi:TIGR03009 family protein